MREYQKEFIEFSLKSDVLRFGEFVLKSGRRSPYFFNAGQFNTGSSLATLGEFYADRLLDWGRSFDVLFGPAYKGIPLAVSVAIALSARTGRPVPFCFNRKEAKDHGEGGLIVGSDLQGKVVIVDDVVTSGMSVEESVAIIKGAGATPVAVCIALDRMERGLDGQLPTSRLIEQRHGIPVLSIADLDVLVAYLAGGSGDPVRLDAIKGYRHQYGEVPEDPIPI